VIAPRTLAVALALAAALPAAAQQAKNPIHPSFVPLAADGKPARRAEDVSADATCGACHDVKFVGDHSTHAKGAARATCIQCHVDGGRLELARAGADGRLPREALRIGSPRAENCAACHGLVSAGRAPVSVPAAFEAQPEGARSWTLTQGEGAILSPTRMSESFLNLQDKEALTSPWDVHAAKLIDCTGCHFAPNDPRRTDEKRARLEYVTNDPRRPSTADFLHRPDHRLAGPDCRSCHDALKGHAFLPYRERHVDVIACQTCHVSARAPAAEMVDATVVTATGTPAIRYRNVEAAPGEALNAATVHPLRPLLVMRPGADGIPRLTPVNVLSRWRWVTRADGAEVPWATVARAWRDGDAYAPEVVRALDADRDGKLSAAEVRLDTPARAGVIAARLRALGVADPVIDGVMDARVLSHGVASRELALADCGACHAKESRLDDTFLVAAYLPGGVPPRPPSGGARVTLAGAMAPTPTGGLAYRRDPAAADGGPYVLGHTRQAFTNKLGFFLFLAVTLGVAAHGGGRLFLRLLVRRRRPAPDAQHPPEDREYVFGRYERIWHWTMALSGIVLMATGIVVHNAGWAGPGALTRSVDLHNLAAGILLVNAGLSLFYHLTTRAIRQFIPHPKGLLERTLAHIDYQSRGIFLGDPHPHHPGHKLNPLQQMTYLSLLSFLFPLQIVTGLVIWAVGHWPRFAVAIGGLQTVAPLHNLGAWLFLAFFVLHTYLVTTGPTLGEHFRSMVTGFRSAPAADAPLPASASDSHPQGA
jgi:thiosulfate reductase cytochrome b subunit